MDELPAELRKFLQNQPFLELTAERGIKCTLNGHELPCNLVEVQNFVLGKKFKKLSAEAEFNYSQYEPHLVPSTKQPNHLFCKLTLRHITRLPQNVVRHINGKRYKKALAQYEECMKQGVAFVPIQLRQKKRPKDTGDDLDNMRNAQSKPKQDSGIWAPSGSEEEDGDSEDSMSDLYPSAMFTLKKPEDQDEIEEKDDFLTDEEDMEVCEMEEKKQAVAKRKKVQSAGFVKKLKKNRKKKGFKFTGKNKE